MSSDDLFSRSSPLPGAKKAASDSEQVDAAWGDETEDDVDRHSM
jgi:hypothetical protein